MAVGNRLLAGSLGLWALLTMMAVEADNGAAATPVPFPEASTTLPSEAELQAKLANLEGFLYQVDEYVIGVQMATETYREYVQDVKEMLAGCEVEADLSAPEYPGFEGLVADGTRQCQSFVVEFDQQARTYAASLDQAVAYQRLVQRVGERVQGQVERYRIAMGARQLKQAVDRGLSQLEATRESFRPWMDSPDRG